VAAPSAAAAVVLPTAVAVVAPTAVVVVAHPAAGEGVGAER
jgi:hypothetical protein